MGITPYVLVATDHLTANKTEGVKNEEQDMGMSDMFAWKNTAWTTTNEAEAALPELDAQTSGMVAGTKVATKAGWTKIESIEVGQQVLTFDGGLQLSLIHI